VAETVVEEAPAAVVEPTPAPAAEEAKPARANRESNVASSEPVVTSVKASEDGADAAKPKKGGWWQKRGFF
jgi:ribonuclease E